MKINLKKRRKLIPIVIILSFVVVSIAFLKNWSSFGGNASEERLQRIKTNPQYEEGAFVNIERQAPYDLTWDYFKEQFFGDQQRTPPLAIPVIKIKPETLSSSPAPGLRAIWFGHASVLIEIDGHRVLVDPVFSEYASPFQFFGPQRFHAAPVELKELTNIDVVVISHDHYDHLDIATIQHLAPQGTQFFVPIGIGAHLEEWGVPEDQINELEWWESKELGELTVICTPNRHYSGRDLFDQKATLWSSWTVIGPDNRFFYSGDTGYSQLFQQIGNRFGPFDLSIIKIGAYGPGASWIDIHMTPEDAIRVHMDVKGKRMLPVHWATFNMAIHDWDEPIKRALKAAGENNVDLVTPRVGELVVVGESFLSESWWEEVN